MDTCPETANILIDIIGYYRYSYQHRLSYWYRVQHPKTQEKIVHVDPRFLHCGHKVLVP